MVAPRVRLLIGAAATVVIAVTTAAPALALTKEQKRLRRCQEVLLKRAGYRVPPAGAGLVDLLRGVSPRRGVD